MPSVGGTKEQELRFAEFVGEEKKKLLAVIFNERVILPKCETVGICQECIESTQKCGTCGQREPHVECKHFDSSLFAYDLNLLLKGDGIAEKKKNMDVYTAQLLAAKYARALVHRLREDDTIRAIEQYRDRISVYKKSLPSLPMHLIDRDREILHIVIVGASVSGLTFHATVHELMPKFSEIFSVSFIDNHQRDVERLLQSRDRTIVPRFEYERLFQTNLSVEHPYRVENPESPYHGKYVIAEPKFSENLSSLSDWASEQWSKTHEGMPEELRWVPGNSRDVARQIEKGYKILAGKDGGPSLRAREHGWFKGIFSLDDYEKSETRGADGDRCMFNVAYNNFNVVKKNESGHLSEVGFVGDVLLKATGLGVDIPGDAVEQLTQRNRCRICTENNVAVYDFPSNQRSYWDSMKPELDVPEHNIDNILIVGNSDAAAGAVFATLLDDLNSCTFNTLADLIWVCGDSEELTPVQQWFAELQKAVESFCADRPHITSSGLSTTDRWLLALEDKKVQEVAYRIGSEVYEGMGNKLRSRRMVYLGIRWSPEDDLLIRQYETEYDDTADPGTTGSLNPWIRYLRAKFFSDAWPENRILGYLLSDIIKVFKLDYSGNPKFNIKYNRLKTRKTFVLNGPVSEFGFSGEISEKASSWEFDLKYVLNCGGPSYVKVEGNVLRDVV